MNERLFQFIWQQLRFDQRNLTTTNGESVSILFQGTLNTNQGPDFLNARLRINETFWAGSVELHLKETDWTKHGHTGDEHYDNVILHVVLDADGQLEERIIPTLSLHGRISRTIIEMYSRLGTTADVLPCRNLLDVVTVEDFALCNERMLLEKWNDKCLLIFEQLKKCNYHFEEVLWRMIAANFGSPVNTTSFESIAVSISWNVIQKIRHLPHATEALLLGQAGILSKTFSDKYPAMLQKECNYLLNKYKLTRPDAPIYFLRMRPANFPTIRLVQLSEFVAKQKHLFASIRDADSLKDLHDLLNVYVTSYWQYHYKPDEEAAFSEKKLGEEMKRNILINTFLPFIYAHGRHTQSPELMNKATEWLRQIQPENNRITRSFNAAGFLSANAFDSQALIYLRKKYCDERRCLQCNLGVKMLK
ncbi:MAG: DUF2851 family protein [Chitinophagaceae bacterium]|nr:MAG: DUF2851 family protein [Chitinophagaceae bacterium]